MKMAKKYYLAYGSNLNIRQMRTRCPGAKIIGRAELGDYELLFKGSKTGAYLTIEKKQGASVPVAVWTVTEADEKMLDRCEVFPDFYYKTEIPVEITGIRTGRKSCRTAFVYIMHEERKHGVPSRFYVQTCFEGYMDFGFNPDILFDAYRKSMEADDYENR